MLSHALNLGVWEGRIEKELERAQEINQELLYVSLRLKNTLLMMYPASSLNEEILEKALESIVSYICNG